MKIKEIPHEKFRRDGDNLYWTADVTLLQALEAQPVEIETLDGRIITVSLDEIVTPETEKMVPNEGMPIFKSAELGQDSRYGLDAESCEKGDLIVNFHIEFPKFLEES